MFFRKKSDSPELKIKEAEDSFKKGEAFTKLHDFAKAEKCFLKSVSILEPLAVQLSQALTRMTFTRREIAAGNFVQVTSNRLQYASTAEKLNISSQMADRGVMTRNEIREIWGLPPVDGGDTFLVRGEYKDPDKEGEEIGTADETVDLTGAQGTEAADPAATGDGSTLEPAAV